LKEGRREGENKGRKEGKTSEKINMVFCWDRTRFLSERTEVFFPVRNLSGRGEVGEKYSKGLSSFPEWNLRTNLGWLWSSGGPSFYF
jgi:hypothetical protein